MHTFLFRLLVILHIASCVRLHAGTLRVSTYNILNFPGACGAERLDDLRSVLSYISPDILIIQEMQSQAGVDLLKDSVLNIHGSEYRSVAFHDGPDTDNALFYRAEKVEYLWSDYLPTPNRDIAEYRLYVGGTHELYVYSVHLKSSQGDTNEIIRLQEAVVLRNRLDSLEAGTNVIVAGDFNFYASTEPAFEMLTSDTPHVYSRLHDPLFLAGAWHDNETFAAHHTQSTRDSTLPDGGAGGGLDDRFDMMLCSENMLERTGLYLDSETYVACGNDGGHFDAAINEGVNTAVPPDVADALYYAADHLPVTADIVYTHSDDIARPALQLWPNPMDNGEVHIQFPWHDHFERAELSIMDITGRCVFSRSVYTSSGYTLHDPGFAIGVYFVTAALHTIYSTYVYHAKLAVTK